MHIIINLGQRKMVFLQVKMASNQQIYVASPALVSQNFNAEIFLYCKTVLLFMVTPYTYQKLTASFVLWKPIPFNFSRSLLLHFNLSLLFHQFLPLYLVIAITYNHILVTLFQKQTIISPLTPDFTFSIPFHNIIF